MKPFYWQVIVGIIATVLFGTLVILGGVLLYPLEFTLPLENLGMGYEGWGMLESFFGTALGSFLAVWGVGRVCKMKRRVARTVGGVVIGLVPQILLYDYNLDWFLFIVILSFPLAGGLVGF